MAIAVYKTVSVTMIHLDSSKQDIGKILQN